jgi:hypothetical protein
MYGFKGSIFGKSWTWWKPWSTYDTEEEAGRACDVVTFYTNRASSHYNFPDSVSFIELTCKRRPQEYDELMIQDPVQYTRLIRSFMLSQAQNLLRNLFPAKPANKRTPRLPKNDNCGVRRRNGFSERICRDRPDHPHAESVQNVQNAIEVPCNQHECNNPRIEAPLNLAIHYIVYRRRLLLFYKLCHHAIYWCGWIMLLLLFCKK